MYYFYNLKQGNMNFHQFRARTLQGQEIDFSVYKGQKLLVVNTASACGLTPQYAALQELYQQYGGQHFRVLAFPSNDFAGQEPGSDAEIAGFCEMNYGIRFPVFRKRAVLGENRDAIFAWLSEKDLNGIESVAPQWNFHKYLVDENGNYVKNIAPAESPLSIEIINWIESNG